MAHLFLARTEVSQRRACQVIQADRTSVRYRSGGPTMLSCAPGCGSLPPSGAGSGIAACLCCSCAVRAYW